MKKIFESDLYKQIVANPKPYTIPYMKKWGPEITHTNIKDLLEKLMVDYLMKKSLIQMHYENYNAKVEDFDQMMLFEKELQQRIGKRPLKMEFITVIPDNDVREQFEKVIEDPDFETFLM